MSACWAHEATCSGSDDALPQATAGNVVIDARFTRLNGGVRYESLWLPLLSAWDPARDEVPPAAPVDIAVVWLAHLSRPGEYARVCADHCPTRRG